jgi:translation initiation factor 5A
MSDDDADYTIENSDAGASLFIPCAAGEIKKGGYMCIKGRPCKVLSISVSKTGKHGHAKCNFITTDIFTGKKIEDMVPSSHGTTVPIVTRIEYELMNIDDESFCALYQDGSGVQKDDLKLPTYPPELEQEIKDIWKEGENQCIVTVQTAMGEEAIVACKKGSD